MFCTLEKLDLQVTQIGDLGLNSLKGMASLKELDLSNTTVADTGLSNLASLHKLQTLRLADTLVEVRARRTRWSGRLARTRSGRHPHL